MSEQELAEMLRRAPPMTVEGRREQRVSFIFGQLGGKVTKERIRLVLHHQGYPGFAAAPEETPKP